MNYKFCDFTATDKTAMKEILSSAFNISLEGFDEIFTAYKTFSSDFTNDPKKFEIQSMERTKILPNTTQVTLLRKFNESAYSIGIDLPIILKPEIYSDRTVFIVAEDPLRNFNCSNVILSTPFGTHKEKIPYYWPVIENLLNKQMNVYLTDISKLWMKKAPENKVRIKGDLAQNFKQSLKKEIDYFKPELIVAYGNPVFHLLKQIQLGIDIKFFPHPSPSNNGPWKKELIRFHSDDNIRCTAENKTAYINKKLDEFLAKKTID